ncbi:MAG: TatD family hydrolase [Candidatus Magasanikbacteria bacterium]|nr:TatD family hydrolase [Candidatus Magasanikbacteria bacterium]
MIIDSHSHIQFKTFVGDVENVIKRTLEKGVFINTVGTQSNTSKKAVEIAEKYDGVFATIGVHPTHVFSTDVEEEGSAFKSRAEDFDYEFYKDLAKSPKVIGIGETGMDGFHIPKNLDKKEVFAKQKEIFLSHYKLAQELDLPLVIHVRDAHEELLKVLSELPKPIRGVVHCFTSNWEDAQKYLDLGLHLGFTGIVTFSPKKTDPQTQLDLLEVVENCPLDRMLVETDAPFLAPQKYRGKRCEPWMVEEVVKFIAEFRGLDEGELKKQVLKNTKSLFTKINI